MSLPIAIVASGNGTNAQAMIDLSKAGILDADIRLVLCNRPGAGVLRRAADAGVASCLLDHTTYPSREAFDEAMAEEIRKCGAELVVLAGYMRLLTDAFIDAFPHRVLNLHPSLLPAFGGGVHAGADALAYGVKISGCTVHFVEKAVDSGPVIIQAAVPCIAGESEIELMTRIHYMEHRIYPQAVQWFAEGRVRLEGRQVFVATRPDAVPAEPEGGCLVWPPLEKGF